MKAINTEQLEAEMVAFMKTHPVIAVVMPPPAWLSLISLCNLALRHPTMEESARAHDLGQVKALAEMFPPGMVETQKVIANKA